VKERLLAKGLSTAEAERVTARVKEKIRLELKKLRREREG
jgi:hypothetical protein